MSKAKPKTSFEIQVSEDTWTCHLWKAKSYIKLFGDDSGAIMDPDEKTLNFRDDNLEPEIIGHELMHAFFGYLHLDSVVDPRIDDIEEIMASWQGTNFIRFHEKVVAIYEALKEFT